MSVRSIVKSKSTPIFVVLMLFVLPMVARSADSQQMEDILSELRKIRVLLENSRPVQPSAPATRITVDVKDAPIRGAVTAPITVVEFMDFECSFCKQFYSRTFQELKKIYIDTGKVRFVVIDFPLDIHVHALRAAEAGPCAAEQGKFWSLHDLIEADSGELNDDRLLALAGTGELELPKFSQCLKSGKYTNAVKQGVADASAKGISATPAFIVGRTTSAGVDGELVMGALPFGVFQQKIETLGK